MGHVVDFAIVKAKQYAPVVRNAGASLQCATSGAKAPGEATVSPGTVSPGS